MAIIRKITMRLRLAVGNDFKTPEGKTFYGKIYFQYSKIRNEFDDKPYYLTVDTDKKAFSELYLNKQIYVPVSEIDLVEITEEEIS